MTSDIVMGCLETRAVAIVDRAVAITDLRVFFSWFAKAKSQSEMFGSRNERCSVCGVGEVFFVPVQVRRRHKVLI